LQDSRASSFNPRESNQGQSKIVTLEKEALLEHYQRLLAQSQREKEEAVMQLRAKEQLVERVIRDRDEAKEKYIISLE